MKINGVMFQYFEWYLENEPPLWNLIGLRCEEMAALGISALWLPPAYKGSGGKDDVGYGIYDLYDLGEFDQKGSVRSKYGTRDEYFDAISKLHECGIDVYADIVFDHKMGADEVEFVPANIVDPNNRSVATENEEVIEAWTKFTFPNRHGKYSTFTWNWTHFDGIDYDEKSKKKALYRLYHKNWDEEVSMEHGNYDYLMGADLDFHNPEVLQELYDWGKWYQESMHMNGIRLDACKHIHFTFFKDWLKAMRIQNPELFAVGEYWSADLGELLHYLDRNEYCMSLFDVPLHFHFHEASIANGNYNMAKLLDGTLCQARPIQAVTFVDNHDTQPSQSLSSWVLEWFKPLAYSVILLRADGYPCLFYGDYYGIPHDQIAPMKAWLDILLQVRQKFSYGKQNDYFDDFNIVGWTREGNAEHPLGLACILSDGASGYKTMYIGKKHAGEIFRDALGNRADEVTVDQEGFAQFHVEGGSVSVYTRKGSLQE